MNRTTKLIATAAMLCVPIVSYGQSNEIDRKLQGRYAGVSVINSSSTYGSSPLITVRGATSLWGTSSPLWIVDGVPVQSMTQLSLEKMIAGYPISVLASDVTGLSEEDIASIEVLTDAASAVLYGERGANGVILVTTRNGKNKRMDMTVSGEVASVHPTWRDDIYDSGLNSRYHLDISGGSKTSALYCALTGINQEGGVRRDKVNDINSRLNLSYTLWDDLSIEFISEGFKRSQKAPYLRQILEKNTVKEEINKNYLDADVKKSKSQLTLSYKPLDMLSFQLVGALQYSKADMALYLNLEEEPYSGETDYFEPLGGDKYKLTPVRYEMKSYYVRPTITYTPIKNKTYLLSMYAGAEINKVKRDLSSNKTNRRDNSVSYFFNPKYTYKNLYSIQGTYRADKYRSHSTENLDSWSLSGDWNMYESRLFESLQGVFSQARLRVSYAKMGVRCPDFLVAPYKSKGNLGYSDNRVVPRYIIQNYDPNLNTNYLYTGEYLTHERLREWNIGCDLGWMHNRMQLSLDWYSRRHDNLSDLVIIHGTSSQIGRFLNLGKIKSYGLETTLLTKNIDSKEWKWNTQLTCSFHHEQDEMINNERLTRFISPSIYGGLGNQLNYKNWSLGMMVSYAFDYDVLTDGFTQVSGSHIRLKDLTVGYHLPEHTVQRLHLYDVAFHLTGSNLCLLYGDSDLGDQDPEFMNIGGVRTPMMRQLRFGVAVKF